MGYDPKHNNLVLSRHDFNLTHHCRFDSSSPNVPVIELNTGPDTPKWLIGSFLGSDTQNILFEINQLVKELPEDADVTLIGDFRRTVPIDQMPNFTGINPSGAQYLLHRSKNPFFNVEGYDHDGLLTTACTT